MKLIPCQVVFYKFLVIMTLLAPALLCCAATADHYSCDVCVVGGGSGGFGAALAAARAGAKVVLVEKQAWLGGTSTSAFVSNWEPGPGCAFAEELYDLLAKEENAVVAPRVHTYRREEPYGLCLGDRRFVYADSLRRAGEPLDKQCSVVVRPEALAAAMKDLLNDAGVHILLNTTFLHLAMSERSLREITCRSDTGATIRIQAKVFVDATGGAALCREAGCQAMLGEDPRSRFHEPSAPEEATGFLNALSLCYRIVKTTPSEPPPAAEMSDGFGKSAFIYGINPDELIVNTLSLVAGKTLVDEGYEAALALAQKRAAGHWAWLREYPAFRGYTLKDVAPMLGIRESYRVVTEYVLTEQDVRAGLEGQDHPDLVAVADHALDIHGGGHGTKELKGPYGIPYRCLIPQDTQNLLVACRGAGFSHIAASSCRLSRTIMALGHAAGLAAAWSADKDGDVRTLTAEQLTSIRNETILGLL